jgi:adenosylcobinamide-phosphate synthase
VLLGAVALDLIAGEPPARFHPVVWIGRAASLAQRRAPAQGRYRQLAWGGAVTLAVAGAAGLIASGVDTMARRTGAVGMLIEAAVLKPSFAFGGLVQAGKAVEQALLTGSLPEARELLRALVSRDTASLDEGLAAAAAIESLAENLTDSVLAPWLAYALFGLPGAYAYRTVNTLDSMIGYRGRYEYLGKIAAHLDDALNLVPARLGAGLLAASAPLARGGLMGAGRVALVHHGRTASPNAGWTMAAMAGALGVRLEKAGAYVLGDGREPAPADIRRARRMVFGAAGTTLAVIVALSGRRS